VASMVLFGLGLASNTRTSAGFFVSADKSIFMTMRSCCAVCDGLPANWSRALALGGHHLGLVVMGAEAIGRAKIMRCI